MNKDWSVTFPQIDPRVQYVGVSRLRALNTSQLRANKNVLVVQDGSETLAVLVSYEMFLQIQQERLSGEVRAE